MPVDRAAPTSGGRGTSWPSRVRFRPREASGGPDSSREGAGGRVGGCQEGDGQEKTCSLLEGRPSYPPSGVVRST